MDRPTDPFDASAGGDSATPPPPPSTPLPAPTASRRAGSPDRPSTTLTRVEVDPSLLVDEQSAAWCRHEVRRMVAWQLIGTATLGLAGVVPLAWWGLGDPVLASLLGVIGAGALTAGRFGLSLVIAPLGYRYVRRYTASPPEFLLAHASPVSATPAAARSTAEPSTERTTTEPDTTPATATTEPPVDLWDLDPAADPEVDSGLDERFAATIGDAMAAHQRHDSDSDTGTDTDTGTRTGTDGGGAATTVVTFPFDDVASDDVQLDLDGRPIPERHGATAAVLGELGFTPAATVRVDGPNGRYTDLYEDHDRIVVAVDRTSGSTTVLTELAGFRVLVTSPLLVPPLDELVVNVVEHGDTVGLVQSHRRLVHQAFRSRTRVSDPVGLFKLAQQRELEAYRELGPLWGAVLDLRCRPRGVRLLAAPSAGDVLLFTGNRLFRQTAREAAS